MPILIRPHQSEFAPHYAGYIARVPEGDLLVTLKSQIEDVLALLSHLPEERGSYRYAPGKWTIREVLGHMSDTERIMAYRALRISRGDATPLAGFDENAYVSGARFEVREISALAEELRIVREATLALLDPLSEAELGRTGTANGVAVTARALAWIIAGHERHHVAILRERYLQEDRAVRRTDGVGG